MSRPTSEQIIFHLDPEHSGVRFAIIAILLITFIIAFVVMNYVMGIVAPELNTTVILACLAAVPVSLLVSGLGEWYLKRTWHSGRKLIVEPETITLHLPEGENKEINRQKKMNQLWWQVPLAGYARGGRERRIPAKWSCVAGQLQQDETRVVAFCYARPGRLDEWRRQYEFVRLHPNDVYKTSFRARLGSPTRPEIPAEVIAGEQGRYWLAERNRWRFGVELTENDFEQFLGLIRSNAQ